MLLPRMTVNDLIKIANASTANTDEFIKLMENRPLHDIATEDEIEILDKILDTEK